MVLPGKGIGWKEFFVDIKNEWERDRVGDVAGSLTFFAVLALFPFLIFLVSLAGVFIDPRQAEGLIEQLSHVAPAQVTDILATQIRKLATGDKKGVLTLGALGAIWAASGGMVSLITALNTVYGVEESRPFWKVRLLGISVTLGAAFFGIVSALMIVAAPSVLDAWNPALGNVAEWLRFPIAGFLVMFLWACLYYVLPDVKQEFKFITPGSIVGVMLWLGASWGFSAYVRRFGTYDATYGALGGVIVLLMWMWISSQVILLGAEINAILEHKSPEGKSPGQKDTDGRAGPTKTKTEIEAEQGSGQLPGGTRFQPGRAPPTSSTRLQGELKVMSAATWVAGFGMGMLLWRRRASSKPA